MKKTIFLEDIFNILKDAPKIDGTMPNEAEIEQRRAEFFSSDEEFTYERKRS